MAPSNAAGGWNEINKVLELWGRGWSGGHVHFSGQCQAGWLAGRRGMRPAASSRSRWAMVSRIQPSPAATSLYTPGVPSAQPYPQEVTPTCGSSRMAAQSQLGEPCKHRAEQRRPLQHAASAHLPAPRLTATSSPGLLLRFSTTGDPESPAHVSR